MDRVMCQISARTIAHSIGNQVDGMLIRALQRDADIRAGIYRAVIEAVDAHLQAITEGIESRPWNALAAEPVAPDSSLIA